MDEQLYIHKEKEDLEAFCYESKRILDKLTMYKFTKSWGFFVPRQDGRNHEFASPAIRTRHKNNNFNFVWRLVYNKAATEDLLPNFSLSLMSFDNRHLGVCVRCYIEDDSYLKKLAEQRDFDFTAEPPIQKEFTLSDYELERIFQQRLVSMLKNPENQLFRTDSVYLVIRVDFEFFEMDYLVCTSLKLAEDLETLLDPNDELTDVTFKIGRKEIKAHKCILAARSPVFAKMFKEKETQDNKYNIDDIEADVFQHLLIFVYCGKTDDARSSNKLTELRLAAENFGLTV